MRIEDRSGYTNRLIDALETALLELDYYIENVNYTYGLADTGDSLESVIRRLKKEIL